MPRLTTLTHATSYSKSSTLTTTSGPVQIDSVQGSTDGYVVKYNTDGKAQWAVRIGSTGTDTSYSVYSDSSNNIYVIGDYASVVTLYNANGTFFQQLSHSGGTDVFLAKYNSNGVGQWATRIAGTSNDNGYGVTVDSTGNVYASGSIAGTATIFNAGGSAFGTLTSAGGGDPFLVKYNSSGTAQWATRIGGTAADAGYGIACDSESNVYIVGAYSSNPVTIFNAGGSTFGTLSLSGGYDVFVVKYNTSGTAQWATRIASTASENGYTLWCDSSNNLYVTGEYAGTLTIFNTGGGTFGTLSFTAQSDAFIIKYNSSGTAQWATRIAGTSTDAANSITIDPSGDVLVTGYYGGTVTIFNAGGGTFGSLGSAGGIDMFLVKYNSSGNAQWATRIGGTSSEIGEEVACDSSGNVYVTGSFTGTATVFNVGGGTFGTLTTAVGASTETFLVKYNSNGVAQWATRFTSQSTTGSGFGINVDSSGNVYTTGRFSGLRLSVYGQAASFFTTLSNSGGRDSFVVKYNTNGSPQWATRIAGTGNDVGWNVATDSSGNMYVSGTFTTGNATVFNADGSTFRTLTVGGTSGFVVKYNSSGVAQWAIRLTGDDVQTPFGITTDSSGNVYITGSYSSTNMSIFNADDTLFQLLPAFAFQNSDIFVIKYNTSGVALWVARLFSTGNSDVAYDIASDSSGNVYLAGTTNNNMTVLNSDGTTFGTIASSGTTDAFLVKYNTNGIAQWSARLGGSSTDTGFSIAIDNNDNVIFTGSYRGTGSATVYNSNGTTFGTLAIVSADDAFLVKYNSSGTVQWATRLAGSGATNEIGYGTTTDSDGSIFICGGGTPILYNADGTVFRTLTTSPAFLAKYNSSGFGQWAIGYSLGTSTAMHSVSTDSSKNVYVTTSFGSESTIVTIPNSDGSTFATLVGPVALIKYDTNGLGKWVQTARGMSNDRGVYGATTSAGDCYITYRSAIGSAVQILNRDQTPYLFLNRLVNTTNGYLVKRSSTGVPQWAALFSRSESVISIAKDANDNILVLGSFSVSSGILRVYNADGTIFTRTLTSTGSTDLFLVKYNSVGNVQWIAQVGTSGGEVPYRIATDSSNSVFINGVSSTSGNTLTLFNSDGTTFGTRTIQSFLVKYNSSGTVQWCGGFGGGSTNEAHMATDTGNNVYLLGFGSASTLTIFNGNGTTFATSAGVSRPHLIKYNSSGTVQWWFRISTAAVAPSGIALDSSANIYVIGGYSTSFSVLNIDGTTFGSVNASALTQDSYIVKYNSSGTAQWSTRIFDGGNDRILDIKSDSAGNICVTGRYTGTLSIAGLATTLAAINGTTGDVYVIEYDTNGTPQWASRSGVLGTDILDSGYGIDIDSSGAIYVTGVVGASAAPFIVYNADGTLFGSMSSPVISSSINSSETFLIKYNSSGSVAWISGMGGSGIDEGRGVVVDSAGNIYTTGTFNASGLFALDA